MATEELPRVTATLQLDPPTYSISCEPPKLRIGLTSHHHAPITVLGLFLAPELMLLLGRDLIVTDLTDGFDFQLSKRHRCFQEPPKRIKVRVPESRLHTLHPGTETVLETPFRIRLTDISQAASMNGRMLSHLIVEATEPQPFIPSHKYQITLSPKSSQWTWIQWWDYGTKEEILEHTTDGRAMLHRRCPRGDIEVDTSGIEPIVFECKA
ncbi:hypothetical protein GGR57DRAFT_461461 [Xylariaceae sp. FL1272]|nr:hypothetical protein GGR57DRAFT_461461 [Xylariaceae sp. FL1272]